MTHVQRLRSAVFGAALPLRPMLRSPRAGGVAAVAATVAAFLGLLAPFGALPAQEPATAERHMVAAANPHATEAGLRVLRAGGSAVDAAIAVQAVLSMVEPQSSGIGGGAFMLYYDAADDTAENGTRDASIIAYAGRETAPAAATADMFLDDDGGPLPFTESAFGGLAVGVPGVMRMLERAHRDHGRLPWAVLFEPAIELAEAGFEITPRLYFLLDQFERLARAEAFLDHYYDDNGRARPVGYRLVNREYAATLRLIAEQGADAMYVGPLAEAIVAAVTEDTIAPGRLTLDDLAQYRSEAGEPLCSPYREWTVCGPRPPSSGGVAVQQILGMLEPFDVASMADDPVALIHHVSEASRLAFADRAQYLADPDFVSVPVDGLLDAGYLRARSRLIDPARAQQDVAAGDPPGARAAFAPSAPQDVPSTSHFSIVDEFGNAVSMTTSVQSTFGSQLMVGGFLLNNQLTDFAYEPERFGRPVANRVEPGKRPLSSMTPTLVLDEQGELYFVIGSPGGTRIINFVTQALVGVLDLGLNVEQAIAAPHFVAQLGPIELEQNTPLVEHAEALEAMGHRVLPRSLNSGLHGIVIDGGRLLGGADPRREGVAGGD